MSAGLGHGGQGPWEDRSHLAKHHPIPACVGMWLNCTYSVQLYRHPVLPGVDHLVICRHDDGVDFPWADLQQIKDRLAPDGQFRWATEVFPPRIEIVDNCNLRHVWVMPRSQELETNLAHPGIET